MIISFSGTPGSGKSTVAQIIADKLGYKRYYIGGLRREAARKKGMTLQEYNVLGETDKTTDTEVDEYQRELGEKEDNFVIEGRTSFYFIPHSIKIYLDVDLEEAAKRIINDKQGSKGRNEKTFASVEEMVTNIKERMASDNKRYQEYYGFTCYDHKNYDVVINTTHMTPEEVVEQIMKYLQDNI